MRRARPAPAIVTPGWWDGLIGPGSSDRHGSLLRGLPERSRRLPGDDRALRRAARTGRTTARDFPLITIRDQVGVEAALADELGIATWACVVGGSMGGMRVLEWCVGYPERVRRAVVLAVGAAATADQIALCSLADPRHTQRPGLRRRRLLRRRAPRPVDGLAIARGIGQVSYRTARGV